MSYGHVYQPAMLVHDIEVHLHEVDDIGSHMSSSFPDSAGCLKLLFL